MKQTLLYIIFTIVSITLIQANIIIKDITSLYDSYRPEVFIAKPKYQLLGFTSSKQQIKEAIIEEFGHTMAKVVECESNFKLKAFNPHNKNGSTDHGLFQINSIHKSNARKMGIDLDTIQGQFQYARYLVDKNGYRDWVCARRLNLL